MKMINLHRAWTILAFASSCLLTNCASPATVLEGWEGAAESELIRNWGQPNYVSENTNGEKIFEYIHEKYISIPLQISNLPGPIGQLEFHDLKIWCRTRFKISNDGSIGKIYFEGNACAPIKREFP